MNEWSYTSVPTYAFMAFRGIKTLTWHSDTSRVRSGYLGVLLEKLRRKRQLRNPGVDGRIILRWIFRKWDLGVRTGSSWLRIGISGRHL